MPFSFLCWQSRPVSLASQEMERPLSVEVENQPPTQPVPPSPTQPPMTEPPQEPNHMMNMDQTPQPQQMAYMSATLPNRGKAAGGWSTQNLSCTIVQVSNELHMSIVQLLTKKKTNAQYAMYNIPVIKYTSKIESPIHTQHAVCNSSCINYVGPGIAWAVFT